MKPGLNFSCPENWENMTPAEGGRFCGSCEKIVTDFTGMTDKEIINILKKTETRLCGRFRNEQLENPFGDYRDRVLALYRRAQYIPRKKYFARAALLLFASALMLATGCRSRRCTHTQGDVRVYDFGETKKSEHQQQPPAKWQQCQKINL